MNIWAWIDAFAAQAVRARDTERLRLVNICWQTLPLIEKEPSRALAQFQDGVELAERLGEPRWGRFFTHWRLQILLFHTGDYAAAQALAVPATQAAEADDLEDLPQRVCLHDDLAHTYLRTDPHAHRREAEGLLDYMDAQTPERCECRFCWHSLRTDWAAALGELTQARQEAIRYLQFARGHAFHLAFARNHLWRIAARRGEWQELAHWAGAEDEPPMPRVSLNAAAERLMWRALALRAASPDGRAVRTYRAARSQGRRVVGTRHAGYYEAWCGFHALGGDHRRALGVLDRELAEIGGRGQTDHECRRRLRRCRLLAEAGLPVADAASALRGAAGALRDPAPVLGALAALEREIADGAIPAGERGERRDV